MNKNNKKQPFEKEIDGRKMRYCGIYNIWVNREGTYAYREYKDPAWNHALQIHTRPDGSKYLDTKSHGEIPLDEAVATVSVLCPGMAGNMYRFIRIIIRAIVMP